MKTLWALPMLNKPRAQELQTYKIPAQGLVENPSKGMKPENQRSSLQQVTWSTAFVTTESIYLVKTKP